MRMHMRVCTYLDMGMDMDMDLDTDMDMDTDMDLDTDMDMDMDLGASMRGSRTGPSRSGVKLLKSGATHTCARGHARVYTHEDVHTWVCVQRVHVTLQA